jgi:SSS family solute:Na+ symporter
MSIGTLIYLFYYYHPGHVNISLNNHDSIFPWFIVSQLPTGIRGLLIAGLFAATMSSLSSSLTSASTAFITDFYRVLTNPKTEKAYLKAARITTLIIGIFSVCIALFIIHEGVVSLWDQYNIFMGLFTGGIGGVFLLGIFTKRANATGAIGGLLISGLIQYLISRYTNLHFFLYAAIGMIVCIISGYIISSLSPPSSKSLGELTIYTQTK